jgi:hypothetical protein
MTSYCKVAECRYSSTHVTKGHRCGTCGNYGHGEIECYNNYKKEELKRHYNHIIPEHMQCTISDCRYKELHTIDAHHCPNCKQRVQHTQASCHTTYSPNAQYNNNVTSYLSSIYNTNYNSVQNTYKVQCPLCRVNNNFTNPTKLFGISNECSICLINNVEILFPQCNHVPVCMKCLESLNNID